MKIEFTKEWIEAKAKLEDGSDISAGEPAPSTAGESDMHARFKAKHQFLEWNRAQPEPLVKIAYEYGVFDKAVSLYDVLLQSTALPVGELSDSEIDEVTADQWGNIVGSMVVANRAYARAILAAASAKGQA